MNKPECPSYPTKLIIRDIIGVSIMPLISISILSNRDLPIFINLIKYMTYFILFCCFSVYTRIYRKIDSHEINNLLIVIQFWILSFGVFFSNHPIFILISTKLNSMLGSNLVSSVLIEHWTLVSSDWEIHILIVFRFLVLFPLIVLYDSLFIMGDRDCFEYKARFQKYINYTETYQEVERELYQHIKEAYEKRQAEEDAERRKQEEEENKKYEAGIHRLVAERLNRNVQIPLRSTNADGGGDSGHGAGGDDAGN